MTAPSTHPTKSLIVEGWRFLPHSYAVVNQWQLLALSRRGDVAVKVRDIPFHMSRWQAQPGLFDAEAEQTLSSLDVAARDEHADVTLRIAFPFDFSPSPSKRTAVFGTLENQTLRPEQLGDRKVSGQLRQGIVPDVTVITPSTWSAEGFYRSGFRREQVHVVPHGVDIKTFRPMPELRQSMRSRSRIADDEFVFMSVGAMTGNKGMDLLLQAFANLQEKFPRARLLLKGMDSIYASKQMLQRSMQLVPEHDRPRLLERLTYLGKSLSNRELAEWYQVADAYVSPYRAEGFNMPVLEAAASGLPIICTRGGATDDFVTDAFARRIDSERRSSQHQELELWRLEPDREHLIALMTSVIEDHAWRARAAVEGPRHVGPNYTWETVVDSLLQKLFG